MAARARQRAARFSELATRTLQEGPRETAARLAVRMATRLRQERLEFLLAEDVVDSVGLSLPHGVRKPAGTPGTIGWLCAPPVAGSGGHTTFFRMVTGMERRGHRCIVYLYDAHDGDLERQTAVIRASWPEMKAEVRNARDGLTGLDACVASGWETAHVLASRGTSPMQRLYFIQDYEPFFYPRGSHYALAEDTYRFGFRNIALGGAVADLLKTEVGATSDVVPFGCDTGVYRLEEPERPRNGVVFFARANTPRRGFMMGMLALAEFHRRHPEHEIHVFGDEPRDCPFPVVAHGRMRPDELNALYNRTVGGLALSFTNVTLVAEEMLAAGNIPVANRSPYAHGGLQNEHVVWRDATPQSLADGLSAVVTAYAAEPGRARAAAGSVRAGWETTQEDVARIVEDEIWS